MIFMKYNETLQFEASAATSLSVSVYAAIRTTTSNSTGGAVLYERVGNGLLTGAATVDTIVAALPVGNWYEIININIANRNASSRTLRGWHVESGGSAGNTNFFCYDVTIPGNGTLTIGRDGVSA